MAKKEVSKERKAAWESFCSNMEKHDLERFKRLTEAGELDEIPEAFTY